MDVARCRQAVYSHLIAPLLTATCLSMRMKLATSRSIIISVCTHYSSPQHFFTGRGKKINNIMGARKMSVCTALLVLSAVCFRDVLALSTGAPTSACTTLTQQHPGVFFPSACTAPSCPFNVSLVAIDGVPMNTTGMYRCGSQHTSKSIQSV